MTQKHIPILSLYDRKEYNLDVTQVVGDDGNPAYQLNLAPVTATNKGTAAGPTTLQAAQTGNANGVVFDVTGMGTLILGVAGTYVGQVAFEQLGPDGATWFPLGLQLTGSAELESTTQSGEVGRFKGDVTGTTSVRARTLNMSSGTVTVIATAASGTEYSHTTVNSAQFGTIALYRNAVAAADVLAAPTLGVTSLQSGGSQTAGTYNNKVVGVNSYGRTTATAGAPVVTSAGNLTSRIPITQLVGTASYDVYSSTDTDPKWVGRITETQRAAGCVITAVGVVGAGGTPGAVDVQVPGTGLQAGTVALQNTAYVIPGATAINATGKEYVDVDLVCSRTGDGSALTVVVIPFFQNTVSGIWSADQDPVALTFGGASGVYNALAQTLRIQARGRPLHLLLVSLAGTGASVSMYAGIS